MKKITILAALSLLMAGGLAAQEPDSIMQPIHVVGKAYDSNAETVSYPADFEYYEDGKLCSFNFQVPDNFPRWTQYYYNNGFLTGQITAQPRPAHPTFYEVKEFRYNSQGCLTYSEETRGHNGGAQEEEEYNGQYYNYYYDQYNRITRKELGTIDWGEQEDYQYYWIYEHEDGGKKVTISKYKKEWQGTELVSPHIEKVTTYLYSDDYAVLSIQEDSYNPEGETTQSTLRLYGYNDKNQIHSVTTQYLNGSEWVNQKIAIYGYDEAGHRIETIYHVWSAEPGEWVKSSIATVTYNEAGQITEDYAGTWSAELGDWIPVRKTVFEYEYDQSLCIVSFWKYNQDHWVRDTYKSQTLLFEKELERQQECLLSMTYENLYNYAPRIYYYEFEITMERMKRPEYLSAEEKEATACAVFPNPGRDNVTVKAPVENAVVRFYDMQGRLLHAQPFDFQTDIHAGSWAPGIYLWEIWDGPNRAATGKWIKE